MLQRKGFWLVGGGQTSKPQLAQCSTLHYYFSKVREGRAPEKYELATEKVFPSRWGLWSCRIQCTGKVSTQSPRVSVCVEFGNVHLIRLRNFVRYIEYGTMVFFVTYTVQDNRNKMRRVCGQKVHRVRYYLLCVASF